MSRKGGRKRDGRARPPGGQSAKSASAAPAAPVPADGGAERAARRRARWLHLGLSLLSAGLIILSFPPYDLFPLVFVAYVPLLALIPRVRPRAALGWGWLTGIVITAGGFYFIVQLLGEFGGMPVAVALLLHLLFSAYQGVGVAAFAGLSGVLLRRGHSVALVAPATYVVAEFFCRKIFIFPWYLSNATYKFTAFLQGADLFGGFGLTGLIVLVNAAIYASGRALWQRRKGQPTPLPRVAIAAALVLLVGDIVYGVVRIGQVEAVMAAAPKIRIGTVEANIGIFEKTDPHLLLNNMLIHQRMSADLEARGADLIVWPETAANPGGFAVSRAPTRDLEELRRTVELLPYAPRDATYYRPSEAPLVDDYREDRQRRTQLQDIVGIQRGFHTPLLFGVLTAREPTPEEAAERPPHPREPNLVVYNTAILLDAEGRVLGTYDKNVRLVFGEWVPLASWLWTTFGFDFYRLVPAAGDIARGSGVTVMELPFRGRDGQTRSVRIGAMICYEDIIAEYGLDMASLGPNVFINIINDAWFGETSAAYHHMDFSVMRTVENRIPLVRATNTGVSSVIDPVGRIVAQTSLTGAETMLEDVPIMPPPATLYSRIRDVAAWAAGLLVLVMAVWRRDRRMPA